MVEYTVEINDGFCSWVFELEGADNLSINNLIDNTIKDTNLKIARSYLKEKVMFSDVDSKSEEIIGDKLNV
ncbi:MAG: hypothetical protein AB7V16_07030 [Vulcanibacillus sp.]